MTTRLYGDFNLVLSLQNWSHTENTPQFADIKGIEDVTAEAG